MSILERTRKSAIRTVALAILMVAMLLPPVAGLAQASELQAAGTITLVNPNGGQTCVTGTLQQVRWTYTGSPGANVRIELLKNGTLSRTITSRTPIGSGGAGSYSWTVPSTTIAGTDYEVRITSLTAGSITDRSDADFSIVRITGNARIAFQSESPGAALASLGQGDRRVASHRPRALADASVTAVQDRAIWVMDSDGTDLVRLAGNLAPAQLPSWSPDNSRIVFATQGDGHREIWVMNADGTNQVQLTTDDVNIDNGEPAWSPDGTKIAFWSTRDGHDEIYVMNPDGTNQTRLTNSNAWKGRPAWSWDNTKIAFAAAVDDVLQIYYMDPDGSGQARLTSSSAHDGYPSFSHGTVIRPAPPQVPTPISPRYAATGITQTPSLSWNTATGAATYEVQVSSSSDFGSTPLLVEVAGLTVTSYSVPASANLQWNTKYYWRARAVNALGTASNWSAARFFTTALGPPPAAPTSLVGAAVSSSQIDLTWVDNSGGTAGFKLERKMGTGGAWTTITPIALPAGTTSYSNTRLIPGMTYSYRVRACIGANYSGYSNVVTPTTWTRAPTLISPASGQRVTSLTPTFRWSASPYNIGYWLQISTSESMTPLIVDVGVFSASYTPPAPLTPGTTYWWRAGAVNAAGRTSWSPARSFSTP